MLEAKINFLLSRNLVDTKIIWLSQKEYELLNLNYF